MLRANLRTAVEIGRALHTVTHGRGEKIYSKFSKGWEQSAAHEVLVLTKRNSLLWQNSALIENAGSRLKLCRINAETEEIENADRGEVLQAI